MRLDAFNALAGAIQTAFGPFMAVYLGGQGWSQTQIGAALSLSTLAVLLTQLPAGMAVDAMRDPRVVARAAVLALGAAGAYLADQTMLILVAVLVVPPGSVCVAPGPTMAARAQACPPRRGRQLGGCCAIRA